MRTTVSQDMATAFNTMTADEIAKANEDWVAKLSNSIGQP
jgi:hypothetical protein